MRSSQLTTGIKQFICDNMEAMTYLYYVAIPSLHLPDGLSLHTQ